MEALAHYGTAKDAAIDYFGAAIFEVDSPTTRKRRGLQRFCHAASAHGYWPKSEQRQRTRV